MSVVDSIFREVAKAVVGRDELIDQVLLTVISRTHSQLEGVAGSGRWLVVRSLANSLGLTASKIRGSADLTAADLVPGISFVPGADEQRPLPGPLSANVVLVENMDRLPPKLQNMVHQAMQERVIEAHGRLWRLPEPFAVFATLYPEERATERDALRDDRFLLRVSLPYPPYHEEFHLARRETDAACPECAPVITPEQLRGLQQLVSDVRTPDSVVHYAVRLARATRVHEGENPDFVYEWVQQGAGPRAAHCLLLAAKARAVLKGRDEAIHEDVRAVALAVLRHRILTNQNAQFNGVAVDRVIHRLLEDIPPRVVGDDTPPRRGESLSYHNWTAITDHE